MKYLFLEENDFIPKEFYIKSKIALFDGEAKRFDAIGSPWADDFGPTGVA